jgi:hypothetical protein
MEQTGALSTVRQQTTGKGQRYALCAAGTNNQNTEYNINIVDQLSGDKIDTMILPLRQWILCAKGNETGSAERKVSHAYIASCIRIANFLLEPLASAEENGSPILLPPPGVDLANEITVELQDHSTLAGLGDVDDNFDNLDDDDLLARLEAIGQDDGFDFNQISQDKLLESLDAMAPISMLFQPKYQMNFTIGATLHSTNSDRYTHLDWCFMKCSRKGNDFLTRVLVKIKEEAHCTLQMD